MFFCQANLQAKTKVDRLSTAAKGPGLKINVENTKVMRCKAMLYTGNPCLLKKRIWKTSTTLGAWGLLSARQQSQRNILKAEQNLAELSIE